MANNNEMILLPVNEPTFGTKRWVWMPPPQWRQLPACQWCKASLGMLCS